MGKRAIFILVSILWISVAALCLPAGPESGPTYPVGFRKWTHVSTSLVGPQSPFFKKNGGFHHIYANDKAMEGYQTGHFPDGSVIVFDLLDTREVVGTTVEGPRRHIDVMTKDNQRYTQTSGWGFEEFNGDSQTDRVLTDEAKVGCYNCHARQKDHDSVFSVYRK